MMLDGMPIERVLISREQIDSRLDELALSIQSDLGSTDALTVVSVLTGSLIFTADLLRRLPGMLRINLVSIRSYPGKSTTHQGSEVLDTQLEDLTGRTVLMVDDILDSGLTLRTVADLLHARGASRVISCVLLHKQLSSQPAMMADHVGFQIPDAFVVGYGLDYDGWYRNLPDIVVLKPGAFA